MANSRMLQGELDKNELDKQIIEAELTNAKNRLAQDLAGVSYRTLAMKPKKYKRPFKFKIREASKSFLERVKVFLGL